MARCRSLADSFGQAMRQSDRCTRSMEEPENGSCGSGSAEPLRRASVDRKWSRCGGGSHPVAPERRQRCRSRISAALDGPLLYGSAGPVRPDDRPVSIGLRRSASRLEAKNAPARCDLDRAVAWSSFTQWPARALPRLGTQLRSLLDYTLGLEYDFWLIAQLLFPSRAPPSTLFPAESIVHIPLDRSDTVTAPSAR